MTERNAFLTRLKRNAYTGIAVGAMALGLAGCADNHYVTVNNPPSTTAQKAEASISASVSPSRIIEGNSATATVTVTGQQGESLSGGSITYGNLGSATVSQGQLNCTSGNTCTESDTITDNTNENLLGISVTYNGNANYQEAKTSTSLDVLPTCTGTPAQGRTVNGTVLAVATSNGALYLLNGINTGTAATNATATSIQLPNPGSGTESMPYLTTDGKYVYTLMASSSSPTSITNEDLYQISLQGQIVSTTQVIQPGQQNDGAGGYAKAGPNGIIYAVGTPEASIITSFMPGRSTGQLTQGNQMQFQEQLAGQHGLEFSPNQKCGYAVMLTANQSSDNLIFSSGVSTIDLKTGEIMDEGLPIGNMTSIAVNPNGKNIYGIVNGFTTSSASNGIVDIDPSNPTKLAIRGTLPLFGYPFNIMQPSLTSDGSTMIVPFSAVDTNSGDYGATIQAFNTIDDSNKWMEISESPAGLPQYFIPIYNKVTPDNTKGLELLYDTTDNTETLAIWNVQDGTLLNEINLGYYNGIQSAVKIMYGPSATDQNGAMSMAYIVPSNTQNQVIGYNWTNNQVTFGESFSAAVVSSTLP